jgi:UPF0271 protein
LVRLAGQAGTRLFHVKPHGALYSVAATNIDVAKEVIEAIHELGDLTLICLAGAPLAGWARESGLSVLEEAFADRRYLANGQLVPRGQTGAVIEEPTVAAAQALSIAKGEAIAALDGGLLQLSAQTLCLHGDRAAAAEFARAIASALVAG